MANYWLAQMNVARALAPPDSPQLAGFAEMLDPVNALADAAPGFVWRLQTEDGNATALRVLGDDMMLVMMERGCRAIRDHGSLDLVRGL